MQEHKEQPSFFSDLRDELRQVWTATGTIWSGASVALRNGWRHMRGHELDYVVLPVSGPLPERADPPRGFVERQLPLPPPPLSLELLNGRLQAIADAANVKGVVIIFQGFSAGLATLQNFRQAVLRLRESGKEVIVFTPFLDLAHYYAASAANRIVTPPGAQFDVLGVRLETMFLKDALAQWGIHLDVVQISPYKTALNTFSEQTMTPEQAAQLNWLLDDRYDLLTAEMSASRNMTQDAFKALIDRAPIFSDELVGLGLVDAVLYEDELACWLAEKAEAVVDGATAVADAPSDPPKQARLATWDEAHRQLLEKARRRRRQFIGVVSLEGAIAMGPSRQPPVDLPIPFIGGTVAGEETLVRLLRQAEDIDNMAALIFHVDSGGGSALASDLIGRQIERLSKKKPVLVYMGNVAASGGYYVSAFARHIMCQPGTITGSIGVINGRLSTEGLLDKLNVNQVNLQRGARAGLYQGNTPLTDEERQLFWASIVNIYDQFKAVVAEGRHLPIEELDPICEGRVWTGRQAQELKLVDSFGDFVAAARQAAEMAGWSLTDEMTLPVVNLYGKDGRYILPHPFEPAEIGRYLLEATTQLNGRPLLIMPFVFRKP